MFMYDDWIWSWKEKFGLFFDMEWQTLISFFDEIFDFSGKMDVHFFLYLKKHPIAEKCRKYHYSRFFNEIKIQKHTVIDVWENDSSFFLSKIISYCRKIQQIQFLSNVCGIFTFSGIGYRQTLQETHFIIFL